MIRADVVIVGGGAAGLMSAIWAGRVNSRDSRARRILILDGAARLGAKILVSGGGRCNVTHDFVSEREFAGSTPNAIRKVLQRFTAEETVTFFSQIGVVLKREETGKLFPVSDDAATVLEALRREVQGVGVEVIESCRVERLRRDGAEFILDTARGDVRAARIVLATGGRSLPKSGSDGRGYELARSMGHSLTPRILPALVPLALPPDHFVRALSGVTLNAALEVRSAAGRRIVSFTGSMLCTHFGLSGPCVLDISRYFLDARADDAGTTLVINWLPGETFESLDRWLQARDDRSVLAVLRERLAERLARALCGEAGVEAATPISRLPREARRRLARVIAEMPLPVTGDRGFNVAEVTAGGVPLRELNLATMESRCCPGLFLCGEICDVDGRIGGYNFQWAWSSGYVAGVSV